MVCPVLPLPFKPPRLVGLSEPMTVNHYENHYGLAVRKLNETDAELAAIGRQAADNARTIALKAARQELLTAVQLHEVYFDSLGGEDGLGGVPSVGPTGTLAAAIQENFGSAENWREEFRLLATTLGSEPGWLILQWSPRLHQLDNCFVSGKSHAAIGGVPLLALDLHSHAYVSDFGTNTPAFIDAFFENLHWCRAANRFEVAHRSMTASVSDEKSVSPEELRNEMDGRNQPFLLDVCLLDDLPKRHDQIATAECCKSDDVAQAIPRLPKDRPIVAYCMYGFQVSRIAAEELRNAGFDVKILSGGISAWRAIGASTVPYKP